jgi:hypothetical protein
MRVGHRRDIARRARQQGVRLTTLMRLVDALGASPDELLSGASMPVIETRQGTAPTQHVHP